MSSQQQTQSNRASLAHTQLQGDREDLQNLDSQRNSIGDRAKDYAQKISGKVSSKFESKISEEGFEWNQLNAALATTICIHFINESYMALFFPFEVIRHKFRPLTTGYIIGFFYLVKWLWSVFMLHRLRKIGSSDCVRIGLMFQFLYNLLMGVLHYIEFDKDTPFIGVALLAHLFGAIGASTSINFALRIGTEGKPELTIKHGMVTEFCTLVGFFFGSAFGGLTYWLGGYIAPFWGLSGLIFVLLCWIHRVLEQHDFFKIQKALQQRPNLSQEEAMRSIQDSQNSEIQAQGITAVESTQNEDRKFWFNFQLVWKLLHVPRFFFATLGNFVHHFSLFFLLPIVFVYANRKGHVEKNHMAPYQLLCVITSLLSVFFTRLLLKSLTRRQIMSLAFLFQSVSFFFMGQRGDMTSFYQGIFIFGWTMAMIKAPALPEMLEASEQVVLAQNLPESERLELTHETNVQTVGVWNFAITLGQIFGPILCGIFYVFLSFSHMAKLLSIGAVAVLVCNIIFNDFMGDESNSQRQKDPQDQAQNSGDVEKSGANGDENQPLIASQA